MSRYGDTPAGMVESAMEFLRVCIKHYFKEVVISIKASNVTVMVETVRRLVKAMDAEDMHFPLHLGVTEAGDGEDGRIKSAVGIGSLLADGIGDTIRVSLSEEPECEIPVAQAIVRQISDMAADALNPSLENVQLPDGYDSLAPAMRVSAWSDKLPQVVGLDIDESALKDALFIEAEDALTDDIVSELRNDPMRPIVLSSRSKNVIGNMKNFMFQLMRNGLKNPVIIHRNFGAASQEDVVLRASIEIGALLLAGFKDGIWLQSSVLSQEQLNALALNILQAARLRMSKTEYISCPGCGRTLYDLQSTLKKIKAATSHLKGLKIGVMGCIVNGPGEMADADYGYVGAGVGRISLYKGKECIEKNIPAEDAISHLTDLIKANGDWTDPE